MNSRIQCQWLKKMRMPFCLLFGLVTFVLQAEAQEKPPRPITVTVNMAQQLNFGSIIPTGTLGTVTVDYNGVRSWGGDVILLSSTTSAALFLVDAEPGTLITIQNGPNINLTGSNGGTLSLQLGESSTRSPFITRSQTTDVSIGGTLTVRSIVGNNPAGAYSGTFTVTFIQQ